MPPRLSIRESIKEGLPTCCLIGVLSAVPAYLGDYRWFSPPANLFIWTIIWTATFFASWKLLVRQGPLMVVAHGSVRNVYMLKDLYDLLGVERCGRTVRVADLVGGALFSAVAVGGSYYLATRYCYVPGPAAEGGERGGDEEKTLQ
jgi:uncharacterized membrane protein